MKFTRKTMPFHQIVILAHLNVVHYFYFIFEKNHGSNKIHNIFKTLQSCSQKSFNNYENLSASGGASFPKVPVSGPQTPR